MSSFPSIIPSDPNPIVAQMTSVIAGFWRRVLAMIIDLLLVGAVGFVLGLIFFNTFMTLGPAGHLVGFAISLPYFCLLNSSRGGGQTVGKRICGVKVVDGQGMFISPARAAVRYVVLSLPYFINGILLPASLGGSALGTFVDYFTLAADTAIVYLYLFNRTTRQSLHDLAVGTYVVDSATQGKVAGRPVWKGHAAVLAALLLATVGGLKVIEVRLAKSPDFSVMFSLVNRLVASPKVHTASVEKLTILGNGSRIHRLVVNVQWKGRPSDPSRATVETAAVVLNRAPDILGADTLVVTVTYGFDIGIASAWRSYTDSGTPEAWTTKINQSGSTP